jgi:hypothetical protein
MCGQSTKLQVSDRLALADAGAFDEEFPDQRPGSASKSNESACGTKRTSRSCCTSPPNENASLPEILCAVITRRAHWSVEMGIPESRPMSVFGGKAECRH